MRLKANIIGLLAVPLLLAACGSANNFAALQSEGSDTSAVKVDLATWEVPAHKVTVNHPVGNGSQQDSSNTSTVAQVKVGATDVAESGFLKPTIYYFPVYDEDKGGCPASEKVTLHGEDGQPLMNVCRKSSNSCGLQGTCSIIQKGKIRLFNILDRIRGQDRYFEIDRDECRFGYGVHSICLDPFYTLAADLKIYKPGDVIFIPAVVGTVLPSGTIHDGFFVVRDKGRGIKGRGRFDFFTGLLSWLDNKNPFAKLGLGDKKTSIQYFKIKGPKAEEILSRRVYPKLPQSKTTP
ncbi:MAG: 3D domain-containing protein [Bacillota bacterium]